MVIVLVATCIATSIVICVAYYWERCCRKLAEAMYTDVKDALELQVAARAAERTGRIRVEVS